MLTQVSIKISEISYFSFSFKINEKKKVLLKNSFESGVTRTNLSEGRGG